MRSHRFSKLVCLLLLFCVLPPLSAHAEQPVKQPIKLRVLLPAEDAKLYFFDKLMQTKGTERQFTTPPIVPGENYYYDIKAVWEPNNYTTITRTRRIDVKAGGSYTIDLTKEAPKQPDDIRIRWVPTPKPVVVKMLKLAEVGEDDVVYDLGCGDGIVVITAVKEFGAKRGVGIDIDADKIKDARKKAKAAGVADKVEFRKGDVLKQIEGLDSATVVALYMGRHVNLKLKPILRRRLKPGSRVVSHRFLMGKDWPPEKSIVHTDHRGFDYYVYLWTIRARPPAQADRPSESARRTQRKNIGNGTSR